MNWAKDGSNCGGWSTVGVTGGSSDWCVWFFPNLHVRVFPRTMWCFAPVVALRLNDAWIVHGSGLPSAFSPAPISSLLRQHWLTAPFFFIFYSVTGPHTEPCTWARRQTDWQAFRQADMVRVQIQSCRCACNHSPSHFTFFFFTLKATCKLKAMFSDCSFLVSF